MYTYAHKMANGNGMENGNCLMKLIVKKEKN